MQAPARIAARSGAKPGEHEALVLVEAPLVGEVMVRVTGLARKPASARASLRGPGVLEIHLYDEKGEGFAVCIVSVGPRGEGPPWKCRRRRRAPGQGA